MTGDLTPLELVLQAYRTAHEPNARRLRVTGKATQ